MSARAHSCGGQTQQGDRQAGRQEVTDQVGMISWVVVPACVSRSPECADRYWIEW